MSKNNSNTSTIILNDKKIVITDEFINVNGSQYNNISRSRSICTVGDNIYVGFYKVTDKGMKLSLSAILTNIF
jgi:hypothetical protein